MKKQILGVALAVFASPVLADGTGTEPTRLEQLETLVITATKQEQPSDARLREIERIRITAEKQQPADYSADDETQALLEEIAKEQ